MSVRACADTFEYVDVSRYVGVKVDQHQQQADPIKTVVSIEIPHQVKNVGQAINYIIADAGFQLSQPKNLTDEARILLTRPLPSIHRSFEYQTVLHIVGVLAGKPFQVLVDPIKREINFISNIHNINK